MIEDIISHAKSISKGSLFIGYSKQILVRYNYQGINNLLQRFDTFLGLAHPFTTLKLKRFSNYTNSQNPKFPCSLGDNWGSSSARTSTHSSCNKTHVCSCKVINDLFDTFLSRGRADCCPRTGPKPLCGLDTQLYLCRRTRLLQCLRIGISNYEFHPFKRFIYHVVNCVSTSTTNTKYGNAWF